MSTKTETKKETKNLTIEEVNMLNNQLANLNSVKTEIVKNRDELEGKLNEVNRMINLVTKVVELAS